MLVEEHFQFVNLKVLNLIPPRSKQPSADVYSSVAADLLKDCSQAVVKSMLSLSLFPDALLISILSYVDTKLAVQYSSLSKRWVNLWTWIPVLNLDKFSFRYTDKCDIFIGKVY
ncbi:F-box domain, cyclin-like protein [Artemisia annua]|uniref:F-box domain, cyclin-like protein n=1 Tax=Artemisia annua TaxID=35608 RepID=A0A2U1K9J5_ARTAN|nr:F-box domain, cyclin-like protein [Artemisia annua]